MKTLPLRILVIIVLLTSTSCTVIGPTTPEVVSQSVTPTPEVSQSSKAAPEDVSPPDPTPTLEPTEEPTAEPTTEPTMKPTEASGGTRPRPTDGSVIAITDANYQDEVEHSTVPVILHFMADWVGPSRVLAPTFEELADSYAGSAVVGTVNVDDNPMLTEQFSVEQLPTIIVINEGSEQARIEGSTSKEEIVQLLDQYVESTP